MSLLLVLFVTTKASPFHDLTYKELTVRSYSLNSSFSIVSSAKELYDQKHAQEVYFLSLDCFNILRYHHELQVKM